MKILVVGYGSIGKRHVTNLLQNTKAEIIICTKRKDIKFSNRNVKVVNSLNEGLKETDILSLSVPLTKDTYNMIDLKKMKIMKKNSIIINTSRGGVVNENDLNTALNEGIIYGAGLDVFEKEPPNKSNPLLENKKVLLSPHAATFTKECTSSMAIQTAQNIIDFFENNLNKKMIVKL